MNVIFLDFDGVLTNQQTQYRTFDPRCVEHLRTIIDAFDNPSIVISSSWRNYYPFSTLRKLLNRHGIDNVIGTTTTLNSGRGDEIQDYINNHPEITNFIVIDDDNFDMGPVFDRVVLTDHFHGLTDKSTEFALRLIKGE